MKRNFRSGNAIAMGLTLALGMAGSSLAMAQSDMYGDQGSEQPVSDTWITTKVKSELATTEGVKSTDISVKTTNGVVVLIGVLASDTAVDKAIAAAKSVKGVTSVDSSGLKVR